MLKRSVLLAAVVLIAGSVIAHTKHSERSKFKSYKGLLMAGYQGWFNAEGDGANRGWYHYKSGNEFRPGKTKVEMWPETSELSKVYKTAFLHADGSAAYVPSSYDPSTVNKHFEWMKTYGIDGVFMQRFLGEVKNPSGRNHFNRVLTSALESSRQYGRAISVMYDLSGTREEDVPALIADWKFLVDSLKVTSGGNNQTYLYHNGKPLVVLWGVGFNDNRKYTLRSVEQMMEFLKNDPVYGGCAVMLGVPTYWREFGNDTEKNPLLHELIRRADIVHPWTIGRYANEKEYERYAEVQQGDFEWTKANNVDYVPVVFPGFSWHNLYPSFPMDQIPRNRGQFYWKQLHTAIAAGASMLYVAMFDEVDEATAIFKVSKNPPVGETSFLTFEDDIPSDYYLYLSGQAAQMLKKKVPLSKNVPLPKTIRRNK